MNPLVSVIINTYNRGPVLKQRALRSVRAQTYANWECIVVDDGSPDNTQEIVEAIIKEDERIRYFKIQNSGASAAKNFGIGQARGAFIAFTDDDDEFLPEYLAVAVQEFKNLPEDVAFLSGGALIIDEAGIQSYLPVLSEPFWRSPIGNGWVFRASVMKEKKLLFDPDFRGFEDLDLRVQFHQAGYRGYSVFKPLRIYYVKLSYDRDTRRALSADMTHQISVSEKYLKKHLALYESLNREALAWLFFTVGLTNIRGRNMVRGRQLLKQALGQKLSMNGLVYYIFSAPGFRVFRAYDNFKNRVMRWVRSLQGYFYGAFLKDWYKKGSLHRKFPPTHEWASRELLAAIEGCSSVLDLGCGYNSFLRFAPRSIRKVGVDLFDDYLAKSKADDIHDEYYKQDVRDLTNFNNKSFDVVMAWDVIEHLGRDEGLALIREMGRIAKKKVIIYTPNGFILQHSYDGNALQAHKSGWSVEDFRGLGFEVKGMDGWGFVRGEESKIRFHPKPVWLLISNVSQSLVYSRPHYAHALFCVKNLQ